ncbi:AAA family ATPase, partial [Dietzia sp. NPDC055343]
MNRLLLISDSPDLGGHVADAIQSQIALISGLEVPTGPSQLFQQLGPGAPIPLVVVIDTASREDEALGLSARLSAECPGMAVVLLSEQPDAFALSALRAGACDVVHPATPLEELGRVLHRAAQVAQASASAQPAPRDPAISGNADARGRVISVLSPKGGVGKTTVATNLAVGLARSAPLSTVLVDLDVQFGDVASALNMHPDHTLLDVTRGPAARDS